MDYKCTRCKWSGPYCNTYNYHMIITTQKDIMVDSNAKLICPRCSNDVKEYAKGKQNLSIVDIPDNC